MMKLPMVLPLLALTACATPGLPPPSTDVELRHTEDARAVFQASAAVAGFAVLIAPSGLGVPLEAQHIVLVFHGDAAYHLLNDAAFARYDRRADPTQTQNPNAAVIQRLAERGVRVEICASTMQQRGWERDDLLPEVIVTPNAFPRIIDLQMDGYAHLDFD